MNLIVSLFPMVLFVLLYVGSGIYFLLQGVSNAFYQISPTVAIIPALITAWLLHKGSQDDRMNAFLDGVRHRDIITMCLIFLLAGAFSMITRSIGSVDATINCALAIVPARFLLIGVFIAAAFISTAIGTSMGTIATLAPIAVGLAHQNAFPMALGLGTIVGGAMFGDNLSLISDTTIAAVLSQQADFRKKLYINGIVAGIASVVTIMFLYSVHSQTVTIHAHAYSLLLLAPYIILIGLALLGINVLIVLTIGLLVAALIGFITTHYSFITLSSDITAGFASMYDIMLLSMLVGGMSGLIGKQCALFAEKLGTILPEKTGKRLAQLIIAKIVSLCDLLLANNTVAIVFSGEIVRNIAHRYAIAPHYSAAWLDIFSCVFQGIIPYGAQILLASSIGGISPLAVTTHVYYCYILGIVAVLFILINKK